METNTDGTGRGLGREAQTAVFTAGISGTLPKLPTDPSRLEAAARKALRPEAFAYIAGGAGAGRTAAANREAFTRWQIWPRVLCDVAARDLSTTFLGQALPAPLLLAPLGVMEMAHRESDLAVARAAARTGVPYVLSNQASVPMEHVARQVPDSQRMFQLYWSSDDDLNASLLARAETSGASAVVITLDTHMLGWRTQDLDLGYLPFVRGLGIAQYTTDPVFKELVRRRAAGTAGGSNAVKFTVKTIAAGLNIARKGAALTGSRSIRANLRSPLPRAAVETFLDVFSTPALTWADLAKAREWTSLPLILKGIVHPDDAVRAVDEGVDGVWVSNHGGRQIDASVPALDVLPDIADRVGGKVPIVFDSGVTTGADAFIALALGADVVALGRPYAYGLGIAGEEGVEEVIRNLLAELDITLGLSGYTSLRDVDASALRRARP